MTQTRYCRICWNTQGWQHPTGEATQSEKGSYVSEYGFGHEEWLFNFGWLKDGYKYAYLQPLNFMDSKVRNLNVILYAITPERERLFVGFIQDCEMITSAEAAIALGTFTHEGWIDEMKRDLLQLKLGIGPIIRGIQSPRSLINFRFKPRDAKILETFILAKRSHKVQRINRYRALIEENQDAWNKILESQPLPTGFTTGKLKSIERRSRSAQEGITFDPVHDRIQNTVYSKLVELYGPSCVGYEDSFVDIVAKDGKEIIFFEIKTEVTAKRCIRSALGQLLEYAHWPGEKKADKLIVVGPASPTNETGQYLRYLRSHYMLPIYYRQFDFSENVLGEEY